MYYKDIKNHFLTEKAPLILVEKQKYGENLYIINNITDLEKISLNILKYRVKNKYIYKPEKEYCKPSLTKEQIDCLPEGKIKIIAKEEYRDYLQNEKAYNVMLEEYNLANKALKEKNGKIAYDILWDRCFFEYEYIHIEYPVNI